jgi:hypothetical protein
MRWPGISNAGIGNPVGYVERVADVDREQPERGRSKNRMSSNVIKGRA